MAKGEPMKAALFALWLSVVAAHGQLASWYGDELRGRPMANGKPFNPSALTCASWRYPLGTRLRVSYGTRWVVVTVTDRGPNRRFKKRVIDLSHASFKRLADPKLGLIEVKIEKL